MQHPHLFKRLLEILNMCRCVDAGGSTLSAASKGAEREFFINNILYNVIAPPFRIGSGDITDSTGHKSGQADIVIEYGNSISFPMVLSCAPRLYLAEGVCAIIEIKSDLNSQWDEVVRSHNTISPLRRRFASTITHGTLPEYVPHFAIGYRGWKKRETIESKVKELGLEGILVLDSALFCGQQQQASGVESLYAFLMAIQRLTGKMLGAVPNYAAYTGSTSIPMNTLEVEPVYTDTEALAKINS